VRMRGAAPVPDPHRLRAAGASLLRRFRSLGLVALAIAAAVPVLAQSGREVALPSLDAPDGKPVMLTARWFEAAVLPLAGTAPAVLLLHGCGGMWARDGRPSAQIRDYATLLNRQGWHALALDSLTPRQERELCTQPLAGRRVTQVQRRRDALAALQWLAAQPGVDPQRLAVLGWSHGGSAVLGASNLAYPEVVQASVRPRVSVAFYPGCAAEARRGFRPVADTLLLVGLADDWTAAAPCQALAGERDGRKVRVEAYEGAHHGFDGVAPLRHRPEVPGGVHPGQGVHVGGHPEARALSRTAVLQALGEAFAR
jgi:dienelactone hydrolase